MPHRLKLRTRARPLGTALVTLDLVPHAEGTRVLMVEEAGDPLTALVFNPVTDLLVRSRNDKSLRRLKELAEGRGPTMEQAGAPLSDSGAPGRRSWVPEQVEDPAGEVGWTAPPRAPVSGARGGGGSARRRRARCGHPGAAAAPHRRSRSRRSLPSLRAAAAGQTPARVAREQMAELVEDLLRPGITGHAPSADRGRERSPTGRPSGNHQRAWACRSNIRARLVQAQEVGDQRRGRGQPPRSAPTHTATGLDRPSCSQWPPHSATARAAQRTLRRAAMELCRLAAERSFDDLPA